LESNIPEKEPKIQLTEKPNQYPAYALKSDDGENQTRSLEKQECSILAPGKGRKTNSEPGLNY
jgi:hypothetical protein